MPAAIRRSYHQEDTGMLVVAHGPRPRSRAESLAGVAFTRRRRCPATSRQIENRRRPADDCADRLADQQRLHRLHQDDVSVVAVVTDVVRDGRRVIGYGFNSNGRYAPQRSAARALHSPADGGRPGMLLDETGENLDPHRIWATLMTSEKPGGHGERSVAVGTSTWRSGTRWPRSKGNRSTGCSPTATGTARPTSGSGSTPRAATTSRARI